MTAFLQFIDWLLAAYLIIVFASVVFSWLYAFNVVNPRNQFVALVGQTLNALTEPVLRPIRRALPTASGVDFSPMVLVIIIIFIRAVVIRNLI